MYFIDYSASLAHHGVKGMKWGVRRAPETLSIGARDTKITRQVKNDYNKLGKREFRQKYQTTKRTYAKRVRKSATGDPFADRRAKMRKTAAGRKMFDASAKAESRQRVSEQLDKKAKRYNAKRSTASRTASYLMLGKYGNHAVNKARVTNMSRKRVAGVIALNGTAGLNRAAEKRYAKSSEGRRTYTRSYNKYYK